MRLFKKKKSKGVAIGSTDSGSFPTAATKQKQGVSSKKNIKGASKGKGKATKTNKKKKQQQQPSSSPTRSSVRELNATIPLSSSSDEEEDEISSVDLGDIPRSISTTTHSTLGNTNSNSSGSYNLLPPPLPRTPTRDDGRNDDDDSIGSPCENMRKHVMEHSQQRARGGQQQKRETNSINSNNSVNNGGEEVDQGVECALQSPVLLSTKKLTAKLSSTQPSITLLSDYIQALSEVHSPDPSADLPSRALRALFALSEHNTSHDVRVAMVREHDNIGGVVTKGKQGINIIKNNNDKAGKLVPALLNFLQRCPRDSSEQYLTLLVLNNLSIPMENKRLVALECNAARVLGRMLLEDVGCHLLVIIIVNLTFCDVDVRKSLLLEDDREVQLIDCLGYALMLSSITSEQLSTLGPIPLSSPEGTPHSPRKLLSILRSTLATTFPNYIHNNDDNDNISPPLLLTDDDGCPFPETARWCLCALKNLTRPGKKKSLDSSGRPLPPSMDNDGMSELSGDAIAARAIIDAGLLPIILRVIRVAKADSTGTGLEVGGGSFGDAAACDPFVGRLPDEICNEGGYVTSSPNMINMPTWNSNSAQDAALYTLMHMTSVSSVREELLRRNDRVGGGSLVVEELKSIVDCGSDDVGIGDRLLDVVTGDGLVGDVDRATPVSGDVCAGRTDLGWLALQCMKARMSLSFLLSGTNTLLAEHEAHSLIELLSHCIENRSKEGPGGYSAATFTLKGVLHSLRCLLVEPGNRSKFASINGARLNALLLKIVAQYALLSEEGDKIEGEYAIDNEAADEAVVSLYYMSSSGFESAFLPSVFGRKSKSGSSRGGLANLGAKDVLVKVLTLYVGKIHVNSSYLPRHAAIQLMLRASFLRFEGEVANLTYLGKRYPSRMDFDFDDELLAAADTLEIEKQTEGSRPKQILFSRRQIVRYERYGSNKPKVYANPIIAAEDILSRMDSKSRATIDDIAIANDIASSAEGSLPNGESYGFIWKWEDGGRVAIDDVHSEVQEERGPTNDFFVDTDDKSTKEDKDSSFTAQKHRGLLSKIGNFVAAYEDEPISIFGFRCSQPKCGRNSVF